MSTESPNPLPRLPNGHVYMTQIEMQRWLEILYARNEALEERIVKLERKESNGQ